MSFIAPPISPTSPLPRPQRAVAAAVRVDDTPAGPWGWLEIMAAAPQFFPGLVFIPQLVTYRTYIKMVAYIVPLAIWGWVFLFGRPRIGRLFPAVPLLIAGLVWMLISIGNPGTNSLRSGLAQIALVISVTSPVFWVNRVAIPPRRLTRVMVIVFGMNVLSTMLGLAQVYNPDRFNPPEIALMHTQSEEEKEGVQDSLSFETSDGRKVLRPCGLSDTPGGAAYSGFLTAMIGMIWALRPLPWWKRLLGLPVAGLGMGVIYLSQSRLVLLTLVGSLLVVVGLLVLQKNFKRATILATGLAICFTGSLVWIMTFGGEGVLKRFYELLDEDPASVYQSNRGRFLQATFDSFVWHYPLGAGLGRWGMMYIYFGDKSFPWGSSRGPIWVELQVTGWIVDGGIPLMLLYGGAVLTATWCAARIGSRAVDSDIAIWSCAVVGICVNVTVMCLGAPPFIGPIGMQFWFLAATLYAADQQARVALRRKGREAAARGMPA